jgi:hypothetical protein
MGARIVETHTTSLSPLAFTHLQFISTMGSPDGAMPAVAPNGDVYVVWRADRDSIAVVKSTNGGDTFSAPVTVATFRRGPRELLTAGRTIETDLYPQVAIDSTSVGSPTHGHIYVVFHADPDGSGPDNVDIFFTKSSDLGMNWSSPRSITSGLAVTLNPDTTTNDSWMASITVSPLNGHIYVTFYDRREDTSADDDPPNMKTRIYRALSTDGGLTWSNAPLGTSTFVPIAGYSGAIGDAPYWGDYNWSTSDGGGLHFTWGDSRNRCSPPAGMSSTSCSPPERPDLDVYYRKVENLSGADLFIQPWGAVTGIGALWQTPDIYVVNGAGDTRLNAFKGTVNHLRAHIRNLGNAPATARVRFSYAPWFAGINDSMFKEIGFRDVDFSDAAGGTAADKVVPIEWDLTDLTETYPGWRAPIGAFEHFCVKVSVEFSGDIHLSNNVAQNNFVDVTTFRRAGGSGSGGSGSSDSGANGSETHHRATDDSPLSFMVVGPEKSRKASLAQLVVNDLPQGFRASVTVAGVEDAMKGFRLKPNETRLAQVTFATPQNFQSNHDVVADITMLLDGKPSGGISARLYRSTEKQPDLSGLGPITKAYREVSPQVLPARPTQKEIPPVRDQLPPVRTIPKAVKYRRTFKANYEAVYEAIIKVLRERNIGSEMANFDRGLINSKFVVLTRPEIEKLVDERDLRNLRADGHYFCSLWLEPHGDGETEIGVDALIATSEIESPMGFRRRSNGTLEQSLLDWIARMLANIQP